MVDLQGEHSSIPGPRSDTFTEQLNSLSGSELTRWNGFLYIYGRQGILLQELIMLVSALYYPIAEFGRYPHWSSNGQHELTKPPKVGEHFLTLLKEASGPECLQDIEKRLVALDVITVKHVNPLEPMGFQDWVTDGRSWCARSTDQHYSESDEKVICQDLLTLYSPFPDRDVHMMAERYRVMLSEHAYLALRYIFRKLQEKRVILNDMEMFYDLALQVLNHRQETFYGSTGKVNDFWDDDSIDGGILRFVRKHLFPDPSKLRRTPHTHDLSSHHIALQTLRTKTYHDRRQVSFEEIVDFFAQVVVQRKSIDLKAWGMVGYALSDLMDTAEKYQGKHQEKQIVKIVKSARAWRDTALVSRTPLEMTALCAVLVRLREFATLDELPQENHLYCGYYLSRAGFLQLAVRFILSGIRYCEQYVPKAPIWRYHFELWSVRMRLGQWKEAERWLSITWERLSTRRDPLPAGAFDIWKQSGELGEFRMGLASLLSDCYIAQGHFVEARITLLIALENTLPMRNAAITTTRVALMSRLLSVLLQLQDFRSAAGIASDLCRELQLRRVTLARQTVDWTALEILACVDQLVHEQLYEAACYLLHDLKDLPFQADSVDSYLNKVKAKESFKDSVTQSESTSYLTLPLEKPVPSFQFSHTIQSQMAGFRPIIRKSEHDMKDSGYTFPGPTTMFETDPIPSSMIAENENQGPQTMSNTQSERGKNRDAFFQRPQLTRWKKALSKSWYGRLDSVFLKLGKLPRPRDSDLLAHDLELVSVPREPPSSMDITQGPMPETS